MSVLTIFFALLPLITYTHACSCASGTDEAKLCDYKPQFVGVVQFLDDGVISEDSITKTVQIKVLKLWKGPESVTKIITASQSAACGIWLQAGQKQLVSGSVIDDQSVRANLCSNVGLVVESACEDKVKSLRQKFDECQPERENSTQSSLPESDLVNTVQ